MAPVNCRRCGRSALVLDGHLECPVCREKRIPITGQLLEGVEPEKIPASSREEYRQHHARVFAGQRSPAEMDAAHYDALDADDPINSPAHYNQAGIEVIDVIDTYTEHPESYYHGNVIKYILRAMYKGNALDDWRKAHWYLGRMIKIRETNESNTVPDVPSVEGDS